MTYEPANAFPPVPAHEDEAWLRAMLDSASDAVLVIDDDAIIRYANDTAVVLFGHSAAALTGLAAGRVLPGAIRRRRDAQVERASSATTPVPHPGHELHGRR